MSKLNLTGFTKRQLIEKSSSTIVVAVVIAAIAVSFSVVTLNFLWDLSAHYNRVIAEKNKASSILDDNVGNIDNLVAGFNVFEAGNVKSTTVLDALPSKYDFPALATSMESLVSRSGLTMKSFSGKDQEVEATQESTSPQPVEIEFSLAVEGDYRDIQKFIEDMDRTIRPMKITRIELKGSDSHMNANMTVITYYQPATSLEVETRTIE